MQKSFLCGFLATLGLVALYGITMSFFSGWQAAVEQFQALWWLMIPLALGFGIQISLYTNLRTKLQNHSRAMVTTSGTSAGMGMLACCAHHATDVLPLIGLSGIGLFFSNYQIPILVISLGINLAGILVMLKKLNKIAL